MVRKDNTWLRRLASDAGLGYQTVYGRYRRGERGDQLLRPIDRPAPLWPHGSAARRRKLFEQTIIAVLKGRHMRKRGGSTRPMTRADIVSPRRFAALVEARAEIIRRLCAAGVWPTEIGRMLNRDHTTILHHLKKGQDHGPAENTEVRPAARNARAEFRRAKQEAQGCQNITVPTGHETRHERQALTCASIPSSTRRSSSPRSGQRATSSSAEHQDGSSRGT